MLLKISIVDDVSLIYQGSFLLEGERVVQFDGHRYLLWPFVVFSGSLSLLLKVLQLDSSMTHRG